MQREDRMRNRQDESKTVNISLFSLKNRMRQSKKERLGKETARMRVRILVHLL